MIDMRFLRTPRRLRIDEGELPPSSSPFDGNAVFLGVVGADADGVVVPFVFEGVAGADSAGFSESAGTGGGVVDFGGTAGASEGAAAGVAGRGTLAATVADTANSLGSGRGVVASSFTSGFGSGSGGAACAGLSTIPSGAGVWVEIAPSAALL